MVKLKHQITRDWKLGKEHFLTTDWESGTETPGRDRLEIR